MAYKQRSINALRQFIETVSAPGWMGDNGVSAMLLNLLDLLKGRGIITVDDISQLGALGGDETLVVAVRGKGLYKFNPNASGTLPDSTVVNSKGAWDLFGRTPGMPYRTFVGDATSLSFTINHKLDTAFPTISVFQVSAPGAVGFPYTLVTDYTATVNSEDQITITQTGNTPWPGDSHIVVVKP